MNTPRGNAAAKYRQQLEQSIIPGGRCAICSLDLGRLYCTAFPVIGIDCTFEQGPAPQKDDLALLKIFNMLDVLMRIVRDLEYQQRQILDRVEIRTQYPWLKGLTSNDTLFEIDHIIPLVEGGKDEESNLRILCRGCHKTVTKELKQRLARKPKKYGIKRSTQKSKSRSNFGSRKFAGPRKADAIDKQSGSEESTDS